MNHLPVAELIPPDEAFPEGRGLPSGFYQLLSAPAPLAGCEFPFGFNDWPRLRNLGFHHVFCLSSECPRYSPHPLELALACELDDLSMMDQPVDPEGEIKKIRHIASRVTTALQNGGGCLIHCAAGRGRTGTVLGVALRMMGLDANQIVAHLNSVHVLRSGKGWPEAAWQEELVFTTDPS